MYNDTQGWRRRSTRMLFTTWSRHVMLKFYFGIPILSWDEIMMTSSNGNIFRVTGHLWREFTGPSEVPAQRPMTRSFGVFFDLRLNNDWVNNREAGDLRRYRAHYDVIVMIMWIKIRLLSWVGMCCRYWHSQLKIVNANHITEHIETSKFHSGNIKCTALFLLICFCFLLCCFLFVLYHGLYSGITTFN